MNKSYFILLFVLIGTAAQAVRINPEGRGEVLIIPYYTVNNGLNTLVTINNDHSSSKAIKVTFREGVSGQAVFTYNVYLYAHDVWSFGLLAGASSLPGHEGQLNVIHADNDQSCSPFLAPFGAEFRPTEINGAVSTEGNLEGYIEIMEMGELHEVIAAVIEPGSTQFCGVLEEAFAANSADGFWNVDNGEDLQRFILPPTGGVTAEAFLIDVASGMNFAFDAVALTNFYAPDTTHHRLPQGAELSLDAGGGSTSWISDEHVPHQIVTEDQLAAVAAAFRAEQVTSTHDLSPLANGQSEVITTFPLQRFHSDFGGTDCEREQNNAIVYNWQLYDRAGQSQQASAEPELWCHSQRVTALVPESDDSVQVPLITGSNNALMISWPLESGDPSGHLQLQFEGSQEVQTQSGEAAQTSRLYGAPVIGLVLQSYTNAAAAEGLLAQYASSHPLIKKPRLEVMDEGPHAHEGREH